MFMVKVFRYSRLLLFCIALLTPLLFSLGTLGEAGGFERDRHPSQLVMQRSSTVDGVTFKTDFFVDHVLINAEAEDGSSIDFNQSGAVGTLSIRCGTGKRVRYELRTDANGQLFVNLESALTADTLVDVRVHLLGVSDSGEVTSFNEEGMVSNIGVNIEREAIERQRFCPMSGEVLAITDQAYRTDYRGKLVFCCSEECVGQIQDLSEQSLAEFPRVRVSETSDDDDLLIQLQASCPVMEMPLGSMGRPVKVLVGKQPMFLCCKGCLKKVDANPLHYARETIEKGKQAFADQLILVMKSQTLIDDNSVSHREQKLPEGVFPVSKADVEHIASQKICPVMEEPLDSMGGPFKVNVEGKLIYICCPGCAKSLEREPIEYLGSLSDRGVKPPLFR